MAYKIKNKPVKEKKDKKLSYNFLQTKLKKTEWENPNKMKFESPFKTFNKQTRILTTGNAMHDTQFSIYIRPKTEVECNNAKFKVGHLRDWDLNNFSRIPYYVREDVEKRTENKPMILYEFKHYNNGQKIVDGYVLTDTNYKHIKTYYTQETNKSIGAVNEAKKYISWEKK
ncbi:MAG TPA: hypothetical protein VMZ91_13500 [Candidatus Paceibacterota bacterium]|nr:hypothetical protein [Candidatus Paceibacterota bacterium]